MFCAGELFHETRLAHLTRAIHETRRTHQTRRTCQTCSCPTLQGAIVSVNGTEQTPCTMYQNASKPQALPPQ